jgi:hypothetical protein
VLRLLFARLSSSPLIPRSSFCARRVRWSE